MNDLTVRCEKIIDSLIAIERRKKIRLVSRVHKWNKYPIEQMRKIVKGKKLTHSDEVALLKKISNFEVEYTKKLNIKIKTY